MVRDDQEVTQGGVRDLVPGQRLGDDPGGLPAGCQHGVGHRPHQPDGGTAVDEGRAPCGQALAELCRRAANAGSRPGLDPQKTQTVVTTRSRAAAPDGVPARSGRPGRGARWSQPRRASWMVSEQSAAARAKTIAA